MIQVCLIPLPEKILILGFAFKADTGDKEKAQQLKFVVNFIMKS